MAGEADQLKNFFAFPRFGESPDAAFYTGATVGGGDMDGDGFADLALSLGSGLRIDSFPNTVFVSVFGGFPTMSADGIKATYDESFHDGVRIALVDVNSDGIDEIVTAPGPGGGSHVRVFFNATGESLRDSHTCDPAFRGGVFVG